MAEITLRQALQKGLSEAIENDPDVFIMGEDIGAYGGAYAITSGFLENMAQIVLKILQFLKLDLLVLG